MNEVVRVFYDVKVRAKVEAQVVGKRTYGEGNKKRYALRGTTKDNRPLTAFVNQETYKNCPVPVLD